MKKKIIFLLSLILLFSFIGCNRSPSKAVSIDSLPTTTLRDVYASHNLKVGTCTFGQEIKNEQLSQLITTEYSSITLENAMKPDYILDQSKSKINGRITVEFNAEMLQVLTWAKMNNMAVRGHTLIWYSQTPEWIFHENFDESKPLVNREEMLSRMECYISQVFKNLSDFGFIDLFYAYDVVNEAWMEDGTLRQNNWTATIGDDYLWYAFSYAKKYAPESIDLYYNDYNEQYKYTTLLSLIDTLKDENGEYLLDGIGLQGHLYTQDDLDEYFKAVDYLSSTGLKLQITELDVGLGSWEHPANALKENLTEQAEFYYQLISGLFERIDSGKLKMDAITFWGFSDELSWRSEYSPLLFDRNFAPKAAFYGAVLDKENAGIQ